MEQAGLDYGHMNTEGTNTHPEKYQLQLHGRFGSQLLSIICIVSNQEAEQGVDNGHVNLREPIANQKNSNFHYKAGVDPSCYRLSVLCQTKDENKDNLMIAP